MRKITYTLSILLLLFVSQMAMSQNQKFPPSSTEEHYCKSNDLTKELFESNPELANQMQIAANKMLNQAQNQATKNVDCANVITVPVVIHYLYNANDLNNGYDNDNYVLNTVMAGLNSYFTQQDDVDDNLPPAFQGTAADGTCIDWCLAQYNHPTGANFHGNDLDRDGVKDANNDGRIDEGQYAINRYSITAAQVNSINSAGPGQNQQNIIQGIAPAWPVNEYLNMYIVPDLVDSSGGFVTAGYTYLPNGGNASFNSIYIGYDFATGGTTIAHECGHWLGLNHVWENGGTAGCGAEDYFLGNTSYPITDTYDQAASSINVGGGTCGATTDAQVPQSCGSVDNIFNIMDYGGCTNYFTIVQANYMYLTLTSLSTAGRNNFGNNINLTKCQAPNPPVAAFTPNSGTLNLCQGEAINFTDASTNSPTTWSWAFSGSAMNGTQNSTAQNPSIVPDQAGTLNVSLTVSNANGSDNSGTFSMTVNILPNGSAGCPPANNECFGAIDLSSGFAACPSTLTVFGTYNNATATSEPSDIGLTGYLNNLTSSTGVCCLCEDENNSDTNELHNTLWFTFTPNAGGDYLVEAIAQSSTNGCGGTLGTSEDSQMLIYESTDGTCNALNFFDCNEDGPSATATNYPAGGTFNFNAGTTYYLVVDEYYANGLETGDFCIEVTYQDNCTAPILGCTDAAACNFDATANQDDGSCELPDGCTDNTACNFDATALCDDGSCNYFTAVSFTALNASYCDTDGSVSLFTSIGGGTFSGPGISGNSFNPANVTNNLLGTTITITYTVVSGGCTNVSTQQTVVNGCSLNLAAKVILEGAFDANTNLMRTNLRQQNLIPLSQPYNAAPWNYSGTESVASASSFPVNMVDWVLVELRTGTPSETGSPTTTLVQQKAAILLDNGDIVDTDGVSSLLFTQLNASLNYHILIRHRNHLDIISNNTVSGTGTVNYDFTIGVATAFGTQQLKQVGGIYAMHAADYTIDGVIQISDFSIWKLTPAILQVYHTNDGNLDGTVQTTDYDLWVPNGAKLGPVEIQ